MLVGFFNPMTVWTQNNHVAFNVAFRWFNAVSVAWRFIPSAARALLVRKALEDVNPHVSLLVMEVAFRAVDSSAVDRALYSLKSFAFSDNTNAANE